MFAARIDLQLLVLQAHEIEAMSDDNAAVVDFHIQTAIGIARTYLNDTYDTDAIFGAVGAARHAVVLKIVCDLAAYGLANRVQAGVEIGRLANNYDTAIALLREFQKNKTYPDLPRRETTVQDTVEISTKSLPKRNNYF
jgi:hypothetical protein